MEYKEIYNPLNDKRVIIWLLITLVILIIIIYITHRYNILNPIGIIVPKW